MEKTLEQLQAELDAVQKSLEEITVERDLILEENASLKTEVARLLATPDEKEKESGVGTEFEFNGKTYQILVPVIHIPLEGAGKVTAADVAASVEFQAFLVSRNSAVIKEVK